MNTAFIVNFIGHATPATIKHLSAITHENQGKWLISKVNFIEEHVAAVIKVEVPEDNEQVVKQAFLDCDGITVQFYEADSKAHDPDKIYNIKIDANDRAGIVNEITHILDGQDVHILDLDCQRVFIAGGGGVSSGLFTSTAAIRIPADITISDVIQELESLSEDTRISQIQ